MKIIKMNEHQYDTLTEDLTPYNFNLSDTWKMHAKRTIFGQIMVWDDSADNMEDLCAVVEDLYYDAD